MKTAVIKSAYERYDAPVSGARPVYFLIEDDTGTYWKHVGWLMPEVRQ